MAARDSDADHGAIAAVRRDLVDEIALLRLDAEIALDGDLFSTDMRPALLAFVSATAQAHGRSTAQQFAVFLAERDPIFAALMFRSLGVGI